MAELNDVVHGQQPPLSQASAVSHLAAVSPTVDGYRDNSLSRQVMGHKYWNRLVNLVTTSTLDWRSTMPLLFVLMIAGGSPEVLTFAHRGDTSAAPDNSLAAIRAATAWADGVEVDVWQAPDGSFRLAHDQPVTWDDLPTLEEAVAAADGLPMVLDLKDPTAVRDLSAWTANRDGFYITVTSVADAELVHRIAPKVTVMAHNEVVPPHPAIDLVTFWDGHWQAHGDVHIDMVDR